jgi:hypothetical protein
MPTRFLSNAELAQLSGFPAEIADEDLVTYFTLFDDDRRWLLDEHRGAANQLGLGIQLCTLPWLGFVPDDLASAPPPAVRHLADQLGINVGVLVDYGGWQDRTRRDHLRQVLARSGWRGAGTGEMKRLDDFLLARAMEHDRPMLLLRLAAEHLRAERVVRLAVDPLVRRVATARERAWTETYTRLSTMLTGRRTSELDRLVEVDPGLGITRLVWLRRGATTATPEVIKAELEPAIVARAWAAQVHLCGRFRRLDERKTNRNIVVTAIARELAGFVWAEMTA